MSKSPITFKSLNKLAIPALIAGIAEPLLSTVDLAIIGNMQNNVTESIAAVGIVGAFLSMLIWVFGQARSAISSIVSQYIGANKLDEIKDLPAQAIFIVLCISIVILLISYPFAKEIFEFYNASDNVLDFAIDYYKIRIFGFPFTLLTIAIFGTFRGLQNTFYPMIVAIIGTITNIIFDYVLVYGVDGFLPAMHLKGAAYASVIAQVLMAIISVFLLYQKTPIRLNISVNFNKEIERFLIMILNLFVRTLALNLALYFATSYAASYGNEYIAAYTIGFNLWLTCAFLVDGYSSAGNILSGKLLGAKDYTSLLKLGNQLLVYGVLIGLCLTLIGFLFYKPIGLIFTKEQSVLQEFYNSFWIILIMQPICATAFIFDGIFKGLGEMKFLRNLLLISSILLFVPTLLLFDAYNLKLKAIWIAFFVWLIARATPLVITFKRKFSVLAQKM